ncbi:hypothetical protein AHMF7605_11690 [Adhaeribacter arboris]|uniref:Uncharacterized protein n=1 Tax=Adhaeribacter arboris TaxID=2072846 RepID=A0A2T2YF56_9BACT|nr:hypothetical protein [Adhaeribacter arboris]PSR54134.1 hypothetical protein AHMF7605_11690 [Adhaeribacter arboris]
MAEVDIRFNGGTGEDEITFWDANIKYPINDTRQIQVRDASNPSMVIWQGFYRNGTALPLTAPYPNPLTEAGKTYYEPVGKNGTVAGTVTSNGTDPVSGKAVADYITANVFVPAYDTEPTTGSDKLIRSKDLKTFFEGNSGKPVLYTVGNTYQGGQLLYEGGLILRLRNTTTFNDAGTLAARYTNNTANFDIAARQPITNISNAGPATIAVNASIEVTNINTSVNAALTISIADRLGGAPFTLNFTVTANKDIDLAWDGNFFTGDLPASLPIVNQIQVHSFRFYWVAAESRYRRIIESAELPNSDVLDDITLQKVTNWDTVTSKASVIDTTPETIICVPNGITTWEYNPLRPNVFIRITGVTTLKPTGASAAAVNIGSSGLVEIEQGATGYAVSFYGQAPPVAPSTSANATTLLGWRQLTKTMVWDSLAGGTVTVSSLAVPTGFAASKTASGIKYVWNAVQGASTYQIQISFNGVDGWTTVYLPAENNPNKLATTYTYPLTGGGKGNLTTGQTYYAKIRALDNSSTNLPDSAYSSNVLTTW